MMLYKYGIGTRVWYGKP